MGIAGVVQEQQLWAEEGNFILWTDDVALEGLLLGPDMVYIGR